MGIFFTSDWHLNETRIGQFNPFFRPFNSVAEQNEVIISKCNEAVGEDDVLYHLGDVAMDAEGVEMMRRIRAKRRVLVVGNYDEDKLGQLKEHFDEVHMRCTVEVAGQDYRLNHYPAAADKGVMNIVGHIHGLWKVQPGMINVGVDAWNYEPLSEERIRFVTVAMEKYYDRNVFPAASDLDKFQASMSSPGFKRWPGL
jgi:calcineurin-like phosphoesterase family protein